MHKTCKSCGTAKPLSEFYAHKHSKDGCLARCKPCISDQRRINYDKETTLGYNLQSKYGISLQQYRDLLEQQNHKCAICGTHDPGEHHGRFCVDHDHKTSHIRGLLCHNCNSALGNFYDCIPNLLSAVKYLQSADDSTLPIA